MIDIDLPLFPAPTRDWDIRYRNLLSDEYLRSKYDRMRRLTDKRNYINRYAQELLAPPEEFGVVVDIGSAFGEFLELCRALGWHVLGVDASTGYGGMGDPYLQLSRMMTDRQRISVQYIGLDGWLTNAYHLHRDSRAPSFINFQGSWAQCWHKYLDGPMHHETHDARSQHWRFCWQLEIEWTRAFHTMYDVLRPSGILLIVDNRTGTDEECAEYSRRIQQHASDVGFRLIYSESTYVHKWIKPSEEFA